MSSLSPRSRLAGLALAAATCVVLLVASGAGTAPLSDSPGRAGRAVPLRPRPQGLPRHGTQHDVEGVVHGCRRRAERRLLPDDRQHERRDPPVRRHRRIDVHGSPDEGHDLDGPRARQQRHGLQSHEHAGEREVPNRHRLRGRPRRQRDPDEGRLRGGQEEEQEAEPLRPLRSDGERQRRRWRRERRRRLGHHGHLHRPHDPRRLRPEHDDERGQPRLRPAGLRRPRRPVRRVDQRLRRDGERRAHAARRLARADHVVHIGEQRQRRPDGPRAGQEARRRRPRVHHGTRLRREPGGRGADGGAGAAAHVRQGATRLGPGLGRLRQEAQRPAEETAGDQVEAGGRVARRVLRERQRAEGLRGQDLPRRDRRQHGVAVGPGGLGRRSGQHVTSAPTARSSRATSTRSGPA